MNDVALLMGLLVVVALLVTAARKLGLPYPILLVLGGLILGFLPGIPEPPELAPELVFLLVLPPILFSAAFFTSIRDFRANARAIGLLAVGLVLFTTVVVGVVAHLVIGLPWPAAFALGAIVSPPDAVAATAIAQRLGVHRRIVTILEGESLVNDATALVALRTATAVAATGLFSISGAAIDLVVVAVGGIAVGLIVGVVTTWLFSRLDDPPVEITISLLAPFAAYLPAEQLHVSGVLAAVAAGLYVGRHAPRTMSSNTRIVGGAVWQMLLFFVNGAVFILIGLQLPRILGELTEQSPVELIAWGVLLSVVVIVTRIVWIYPATYLPRKLSARIRANDPNPPARAVFVVGWAGMRGVVSLAAALGLPFAFPQRDLIIFLTFCVILATLVGQGLTLPPLIARLGVGTDGSEEHEEGHARVLAAEAAVARLDTLAAEWPDHGELIHQLRSQYEHRSEHIDPHRDGSDDGTLDRELVEHKLIREAVIRAERDAIIDLRDRGVIGDEVLRRVERDLDLEELRMEA